MHPACIEFVQVGLCELLRRVALMRVRTGSAHGDMIRVVVDRQPSLGAACAMFRAFVCLGIGRHDCAPVGDRACNNQRREQVRSTDRMRHAAAVSVCAPSSLRLTMSRVVVFVCLFCLATQHRLCLRDALLRLRSNSVFGTNETLRARTQHPPRSTTCVPSSSSDGRAYVCLYVCVGGLGASIKRLSSMLVSVHTPRVGCEL